MSAGNLGGGDGYYYACILNGWFYGDLEHYSGKVALHSLVTQCEGGPGVPSLSPSAVSDLYSSGDDAGGDEETAIIVAAVLVPVLLLVTALVAYCLWRRR